MDVRTCSTSSSSREAISLRFSDHANTRFTLQVGLAIRLHRTDNNSSDLHLLLNTLASSSTLRSSESWLPICFPKFNPAGFVHAYVSYVLEDVGLVFVSADREAFEELRGWKQIVLEVSKFPAECVGG